MVKELASRDEAPSGLRMDGVSIWWITFSTIWTAVLIGGMVFLYTRRQMPILRIRGLPLSFGAVILLHIYWLAVQWGYTYGHLMPAYVEFWIMSIWFPFGIALFHASNSRFLYVAQAQKRYLNSNTEPLKRSTGDKKSLWGRFRSMDYTNRMLLLVCMGMIFQFFLTVVMFLLSKKFHPSFGVSGTEVTGSPNEQKVESSRGWEWWPSVFWQCFWAWIVAPLILWRARDLHDSLGWRFQTIACCLSNLHAAPMWLIALYVPGMAPVNQYWIPPQWIALSIMLLEIFTIFVPCWEAVKAQTLKQETLESIARWEARNKAGAAGTSVDTGSTYVSWKKGRSKRAASVKSANSSILTMDALEHTLTKNPEPLQHFSALRDFSGENIAFLTRIAKWRNQFYPRVGSGERKSSIPPTEVDMRECFEVALRIYIDFVSSRGAEFQVNLSSTDFRKLESIFEDAARVVYGEETSPDPATPFETANWRIGSEKTDRPSNGSEDAIMSPTEQQGATIDNIRYWGEIPETFDEAVFDNAEISIKYLVLTNTWPKFVKERRSIDSLSALEANV